MKTIMLIWAIAGNGRLDFYSVNFESMSACLRAQAVLEHHDDRIKSVCVEAQAIGDRRKR